MKKVKKAITSEKELIQSPFSGDTQLSPRINSNIASKDFAGNTNKESRNLPLESILI